MKKTKISARRSWIAARLPHVQLTKLSACVAAVIALVAFAAICFPAMQIADLHGSLHARARTTFGILADGVRPALVTEGGSSVHEMFESVAQDRLVMGIALFRDDGRLLESHGRLASDAPSMSRAIELSEHGNFLRIEGPVIASAGRRGVMVVEISRAEFVGRRRTLAITSACVFVLALFIAIGTARTARVVAGLKTIADRHADELQTRNGELRVVLDSIGQGFLTLDPTGAIRGEYSNIVATWLGPPKVGDTLWQYLRPIDPHAATLLEVSWEWLLESSLPREVMLDQLPKRIEHGSSHFELNYRPIFGGAWLEAVIVVISDVTQRVEHERTQFEQRELTAAIRALLDDRFAFLDFCEEADALVARATAAEGDSIDVARAWHTLKGNFQAFGFESLASLCHEAEARIVESAVADRTDAFKLRSRWSMIVAAVRRVGGSGDADRVEIERGELESAIDSVRRGASRSETERRLASWTGEPVAARLRHVGTQAAMLARRLGKGEIRVVVDDDRIRVPRQRWAPFWSILVHAARNAVDHGLETPWDREMAHKESVGTVTLRAVRSGASIAIEIEDDGRGIDWEGVRRRARSRGLPADTHEHLVDALRSGLSTRGVVTTTSGRGIGFGALFDACERLGGETTVASVRGRGTLVRFMIPESAPASTGTSNPRLTLVSA